MGRGFKDSRGLVAGEERAEAEVRSERLEGKSQEARPGGSAFGIRSGGEE
jgi:hypothetical protein